VADCYSTWHASCSWFLKSTYSLLSFALGPYILPRSAASDADYRPRWAVPTLGPMCILESSASGDVASSSPATRSSSCQAWTPWITRLQLVTCLLETVCDPCQPNCTVLLRAISGSEKCSLRKPGQDSTWQLTSEIHRRQDSWAHRYLGTSSSRAVEVARETMLSRNPIVFKIMIGMSVRGLRPSIPRGELVWVSNVDSWIRREAFQRIRPSPIRAGDPQLVEY